MPVARNGAGVLVETLAAAGVRTIFSLSGNQIMPIYDACIDAGVRIVHTRHEAAAVAMADAWAQVTGEIGVALVTAAPGFANALSPLFSARAAESPVLLLSGDSPVAQDGMGAFQELDQTAISGPLVKDAIRPVRADRLAADTARAIRTARSGRPGPVHMALPFDVLQAKEAGEPVTAPAAFAPRRQALSGEDAQAIAGALARAERPLVLVSPSLNETRGGDRAARLAEAMNVPVVAMESPRGLRDPSLGAFTEMMRQADLVVLLGKVADFTLGFLKPGVVSPDAKVIAVDPDDAALERAHGLCGARLVHVSQADAPAAADALIATGHRHAGTAWKRDVDEAIAWRGETRASTDRVNSAALCAAVAAEIGRAKDPILVSDGGEFGQWAQGLCGAPTRIINGMSGAIGSGLPYAIAAKIARPEATVFLLMGDGTAGFHFAEFETAAREGAGIVAVIGNDSLWNAEHQIQLREYGPDRLIGCELSPKARYDLAAAAFGCHGEYVEAPADLEAALSRAVATDRPACVNVVIDGLPAPVFARKGPAAAATH